MVEGKESAVVVTLRANEYRVCPNCGNLSLAKEQQHYCVWCGTKLVGECQQCGKPILYPHGRFCHHCGNRYGFARVHNGLEQRLLNTSESAIKVWVRQEGRKLESGFPFNDPLIRRKA